MKNLGNLKATPFTNDEVMKLTRLYEFKGKDFYYASVMKSDLESIIKQTIEKECFQLVKYLKLDISENRQNLIIRKNNVPKNNTEKLVVNFKRIISGVQADPQKFELITNQINIMMKTLYNGIEDISFNSKTVNVQVNLLVEKRRTSTREDLEKLLNKYVSLSSTKNYERTYLITNFYVDFIHMNIFSKGNELAGLLMIYILLFRERFDLFKYVSFFELINLHDIAFEDAKLHAGFNYDEGYSETGPLQKVIIDFMLEGYNKVDSMQNSYTLVRTINKTDDIENTIYKLPQIFSKDDIRLAHPYTSESTINRTLQRLRDENVIRPNGVGRSASWIRLVDKEQFNPDVKQINLFEIND